MTTRDPLNFREQVIRLRLSWHGPLVWVAHLDRMRAVERALRRARWPLAYSQGYNPRPQIVFALPSGVGIASDAEYIDVSLEKKISPPEAAGALQEMLPAGIELREAAEIPLTAAKKLMGSVRAADYRFEHPGIAAYFEKILACEDLSVMKFSKKKEKSVNIRPLIWGSRILSEDAVRLRTAAGSRQNLRPDLVLDALHKYGGDEAYLNSKITKEELWILPKKKAGYLTCPMEAADLQPGQAPDPSRILPWDEA